VLDRASPDFRDPKVFWHDGAAGSYWVMVAVEAAAREVVLYKSRDLKSWEYLSAFGPANATGGLWECPDLFELPVDGDPAATRWVLVVNLSPGGIAGGSGGQYFIGEFDGVTFRSESTVTEGMQADDSRMADYGWLDWGRDYYAAVSFSDVPEGRRVMIGWMNNWQYAAATPTTAWRGAMSLPREMRLATSEGSIVLLQEALDPLGSADSNAGGAVLHLAGQVLDPGITWLPAHASGEALRIDAEFRPHPAGEVGLILRSGGAERTLLSYDAAAGELRLDRTASGDTGFHADFPSVQTAAVRLKDGLLRLRVYVDSCSVEVFAQDGLVCITDQIFPGEASTAVGIFAGGDGGTLTGLDVVR
jgi:levanase/fructan beta-fructosidase